MGLLLQLFVNGVYVGSVYALLGMSFALIFATTKIWHFAQGAVYAGGALIVIALAHRLTIIPAVLMACVAAGAAGLLCQTALYEPLLRRRASMLVIVIASLGVTIIAENLLAIAFGPSQKTLLVDVGPPTILGGTVISTAQLLAPVVTIILTGSLLLVMKGTQFGRKIQALIADEELLSLQGIGGVSLRRSCVLIGSALLPIPAALLMLSGTGVSPFIGMPAVLIGAMALFIGGMNSLLGAAIGEFLIGFVENVALFVAPSSWQAAVTYSLCLILIIIRPTGLFGRGLVQTTV